MDKVTGRAKEATGSLTGNKDKKAEGQADQTTVFGKPKAQA